MVTIWCLSTLTAFIRQISSHIFSRYSNRASQNHLHKLSYVSRLRFAPDINRMKLTLPNRFPFSIHYGNINETILFFKGNVDERGKRNGLEKFEADRVWFKCGESFYRCRNMNKSIFIFKYSSDRRRKLNCLEKFEADRVMV